MTQPLKFGRQKTGQAPFWISDLEFSSQPLSLAEEKALAKAGAADADDEGELMDGLLTTLAEILNRRAADQDNRVDVLWLLDNLSARDLEGVVEHLRQA